MTAVETDVLIVGAGPTGLAAAALLARHGVRVRVLEKRASRSDTSRAFGLLPGTLECIEGFLEPSVTELLRAAGVAITRAEVHVGLQKPIGIGLQNLPTRQPFLVLEQCETERILEEYLSSLGVEIERGREVIALEQAPDYITVHASSLGGRRESIKSVFVIGCDGAGSTVRRQLGISFLGYQYEGNFMLADAKLKGEWPESRVQAFVSGHGVLDVFPLGRGWMRLIAMLKTKGPVSSAEVTMPEFQSAVDVLSERRIEITEHRWLTRFNVHKRLAQTYRSGRAFLAGDAAHIHSPAGGQGLNLGIQDAFNLATKIIVVLRGGEDSLLDRYEPERRPAAMRVLRGTNLAFRIMLLRERAPVTWARSLLFPRLVRWRPLQKLVLNEVSALEPARREIARKVFRGRLAQNET
ncbi:MAG TPA: FAD-dependent oxidoreductase [Bdellovibrionales bacterium]|nr:FAD-dependent oxidoreductase [Bdellovibrionales bacterium]